MMSLLWLGSNCFQEPQDIISTLVDDVANDWFARRQGTADQLRELMKVPGNKKQPKNAMKEKQ